MSVSFRLCGRIATVSARESGDFEWSGDPATASLATRIMHDNAWTWGRFLSDELFLVRRVAKLLGNCEVVDADSIAESLREGWVQLLRDNLMPDADLGLRIDDLIAWRGLGCQIEARGAKLSLAYGHAPTRLWPVSGVVSVRDPTLLRFASQIGKTAQNVRRPVRSVMWERIVCVHFSHSVPTPEIVVEHRAKARDRLAGRYHDKGRKGGKGTP